MAEHRHKRETRARRTPRAVVIAGPLAVLATAGAVTLGVAGATPAPTDLLAADVSAPRDDVSVPPVTRPDPVSRSANRGTAVERAPVKLTKVELALTPAATRKAVQQADRKLWTQADLNLWDSPEESAAKLGVLEVATRVLVTGRSLLGRDEIVLDGKARWVTAGYLAEEEPFALGGDCTNGTSVPSGVSENIKKVHAAVCAEFPEISVYGTFRSDGEHSQGIAVDIMVSGERGWQVAEFVREYYQELGVSYLIYSQQIWSVERASEGWRPMEDRGSTTANHYDHVHVTTY